MRVLAGLMLVALLAVNGSPVAAETEDDAIESAATAMIRNILGFPFVALPFELAPVDGDDEVALPSPFMTGNCDPVGGVHVSPNGSGGGGGGCTGGEDPGGSGGGGGGSGGGSGD